LADELETLNELESQVKELAVRSEDDTLLAKKIISLFDSILLKRLENEDGQTISIISDHLANIIAETSKRDPEALSRSLQDVLASAVSEGIASNRDAMIDSLYPIMGGMISKYVTATIKELMETINKKIDDGLSLERFKRKIKSKLTGVSETELLLEESSDAKILSLFVIEKESGLLIGEANLKESEISDPHMVASMASAIKDFINDWIQNSDDPSEVQLVSYGNATLYIESAGSVYLIAFMDAEPDQEQRTKINRFFASLLKEYMTFFQTFDGDDRAEEIVSLKQEMQHYLNAQQTNLGKEKKKSKYMQFVVLAAGILLFAGMAEWAKEIFDEYQIKKEVFEQSGYEIGIDINDQTVTVTGSVDTFADFKKIKKAIEEKSGLKIVDRITMPLMQINKMILDEKKSLEQALAGLQEHIAVLEKNIKGSKRIIVGLEQNVQESNRSIEELSNTVRILQNKIAKAEQERTLRLKKIDRLMHLKNDLDKVLAEKFKKNPYFNPAVREFVFSDNMFFEKGKTLLDNDAQKIIAVNVNKYINTLMAIPEAKKYLKKIFIKGHTDSDGNIGYNKRLSKERAKNVEKFIADMDIVKQNRLGSLLDSRGFASQFPVLKNGMEDKNASRRIEIEFQFDDKRLENDIAGLLTAVDKQ